MEDYTMNSLLTSTRSISPTAWLILAVVDGRLVININLPLRWIIVFTSVLATTFGYPAIFDLMIKIAGH